MTIPESVDRLYAAAIAADATLPLLTWYDDATGERVELSGATLDNWRAKTANLLVDECALGPGDSAQVLLPPHWQTAAVLLGCWSAGVAVRADAGDAAFGTPATVGQAGGGQRYVLGLAPLGAPTREVPPGAADYIAAVRGQGDRFAPYDPPTGATGAWDDTDHAALCADAARRAAALGIPPGGRVLVDAGRHPDPRDWLLAPLAARASVVLCGNHTPSPKRLTTERVTATLA